MKFLKIIYYIVFALILTVALLLIISIFPVTGNFKTMIVKSGSMEPAIKTGSIVAVYPADEYKVNDVVSFRFSEASKETITHRIVEIKTESGLKEYVTQGDANESSDNKTISDRQIIGKVLFSVPYAGYVVEAAKKPIGFFFIVIFPILIIIGDEIRKIIQELIKVKKQKLTKNEE